MKRIFITLLLHHSQIDILKSKSPNLNNNLYKKDLFRGPFLLFI